MVKHPFVYFYLEYFYSMNNSATRNVVNVPISIKQLRTDNNTRNFINEMLLHNI